MTTEIIKLERIENLMELFGSFDENIKQLESHYAVNINYRDDALRIMGEERSVQRAIRAINSLVRLQQKGEALTDQNVRYVISLVDEESEDKLCELSDDCVCITVSGKPIKPKTLGQKNYVNAIRKNPITFGVGPAGTGKTYLAVALAVNAFRKGDIKRIILTRPAVEAGEKLGFLPGDLQQKIDPYLRPLYDALFDTLGSEGFNRAHERGEIEIAPLAYMRGRTLDDSFIILDEAQNTTREQMKMFLTRMGYNSKIVVTGDITQVDLPRGVSSGLVDAIDVLKNIDDIEIVKFNDKDVVRHRLVAEIIKAYQKRDDRRKNMRKQRGKNEIQD